MHGYHSIVFQKHEWRLSSVAGAFAPCANHVFFKGGTD
jgi:hypothetical protein